MDDATVIEHVDDAFALRSLLFEAEAEQVEANRRLARQCESLADVLQYARSCPELYVGADHVAARPDAPVGGPGELAVRCAALEASSRLRMTEHRVRSLAAIAAQARGQLPRVWQAARDGFVTIEHVKVIAGQLVAFAARPELIADFDALMREVAISATVPGTRRQAREVADRLTARTRTARHAAAFARRHVYVDPAPDGMSWVCALVATERAHGIDRTLTATAKHLSVQQRDGRTISQIRADLFADLLTGAGGAAGPTGAGAAGAPSVKTVTTKVLVTIPLDRLTPAAQATVRPGTGRAGLDLNRDCLIPGVGPIDDATARQLLLDAGAFTRVITDPVTGVILDMDRRSRRATPAQRDWLALLHGTCLRDGCDRLAIDADIDHHCAYHGPGRGPTDIANLDPMCDPDHTVKDATLLRHRRRDDGSIEVEFPSGHRTENPFAGIEERVRALIDAPHEHGDDPPF